MSFFNRLAEIIGEEYSVQITAQKKGHQLSVSIVPKTISDKDKAGKTIVPIVITGTPDQIDAGIIAAIAQPVQSLNQLVVSGQAFTKDVKKATTDKKAKPVVEEKPKENSLDFRTDESATKAVEKLESVEKSDTASKPDVAEVKITSASTSESFSEDTGEAMPSPGDLIDKPVEAEIKGAPALEEAPVPDGQNNMFDDEDWA